SSSRKLPICVLRSPPVGVTGAGTVSFDPSQSVAWSLAAFSSNGNWLANVPGATAPFGPVIEMPLIVVNCVNSTGIAANDAPAATVPDPDFSPPAVSSTTWYEPGTIGAVMNVSMKVVAPGRTSSW